jgi:hypothetical protein
MKILVKAPSRERPFVFSKTIGDYINLANDNTNITYFGTFDSNDKLINAYEVACARLGIDYHIDHSGTKVRAINRDLELISSKYDWDILVLYSDDMICKVRGWDDILRKEMAEHFPDTDGVLWHNDGYVGKGADLSEAARKHGMNPLNTMVIIGRKYLQRFGYIYHPDYHSLCCDIEFMHVADRLKKQQYFSQVLWRHEHYSNSQQFRHTYDALMQRTQAFHQKDLEMLRLRESLNFGLC